MSTKPLKKISILLAATSAAGALAACGSQEIEVASNEPAAVKQGAQLFYERCSGCHTLTAAGAEGSAYNVHDVERVDGPNFDQRKETKDQVLYAIRNGGFSGAIMPQNIVVGEEADAVADFVSKYSGSDAETPPAP
ncbi:MAG TPA: cytochrome c [Capillimicrobium sp.]|nr:cytochrome c [Capillimicrobium sp.]